MGFERVDAYQQLSQRQVSQRWTSHPDRSVLKICDAPWRSYLWGEHQNSSEDAPSCEKPGGASKAFLEKGGQENWGSYLLCSLAFKNILRAIGIYCVYKGSTSNDESFDVYHSFSVKLDEVNDGLTKVSQIMGLGFWKIGGSNKEEQGWS